MRTRRQPVCLNVWEVETDQEPKRNEAAFPVIWTITDVSIWIDLLNLVCNRIIDPKLIERIRVPVLRDEHGFLQSGHHREWNAMDDMVARYLLEHCLRFRTWLNTYAVSQGRICIADHEQMFMCLVAEVVLRCSSAQESELSAFMGVTQPKRLILQNLADLRHQYRCWQEHLAERPERVLLDFRRVTNSYELQQILKDGLFSQIFTE